MPDNNEHDAHQPWSMKAIVDYRYVSGLDILSMPVNCYSNSLKHAGQSRLHSRREAPMLIAAIDGSGRASHGRRNRVCCVFF